MIEQIQGYLFLTVYFFLLFISSVLYFERYKKSIQAFWAKQSWLWKIPWDPTIKIICLWAGILFARKLIYYVPCHGIIQTTSSIWWVDTCALTGLCFIFSLFLVAAAHSIKDNHYKSSVLRVAAMEIAENGDNSWATSIAKDIPDMRIRTSALEIIRQRKEEK